MTAGAVLTLPRERIQFVNLTSNYDNNDNDVNACAIAFADESIRFAAVFERILPLNELAAGNLIVFVVVLFVLISIFRW